MTGIAIAAVSIYTSFSILQEDDLVDEAVHIIPVKSGKSIWLYAFSERWKEGTIAITVKGTNASIFPREYIRRGLSHDMTDPIYILTPVDKRYDLTYKFKNRSWPGSIGGKPDLNFKYQLPFRIGRKSRICGAYGTKTHRHNNEIEYAIDFAMPVGTVVCAARSGTVIAVREESDSGGPDLRFAKAANYVFIKHDDGSIAQYYHLSKNGVLVKPGDQVKTGDFIGLSGVTGWTSGPHLHFEVFTYALNGKKTTVPVTFETFDGLYCNPKMGDIVSRPYPKYREKTD